MDRIKKIAFLKMHDVWFDLNKYYESKYAITALHTNEVLPTIKYDFCLDAKTFLLDISGDMDAVFAGFEYKSARYAINRAIRDEVVVKEVTTEEECQRYMDFQEWFCKEKGIPVLQKEELENLSCYYAISKEGEYLGACAFIESADKETVRYKYGATLHKMNANEIILWRVMQEYHEKGFKFFDFGGCMPTDDKECYYYRHYHFKKKFGGELIDSYTYFRIKGVYRVFFYIFKAMVNVFFKGDVNAFTNWLNQKKILK